jgi:hypothetical protein
MIFKSIKKSVKSLSNIIKLSKLELIIFIISFLFAFFANTLNLNVTHFMYGSNDNILYGSTLGSPDNAWYLNQIKNYLNGFGFTIDHHDPIYAVRRTPGYPLFYGLHYYIFGEVGSHFIIPYTQTFLHALASVFLMKIGIILFANTKVSFLAGLLYGLSPAVVAYLYMTMTESIFPAMIIFTVFLSMSAVFKKSLFYSFFSGLMFTALVMVSPRTGLTMLFIIALVFYYKNLNNKEKINLSLVFCCTFIISMSPWTIRNYLLLEKFIPLETYHLNHTMEDQNIKLIALTRWWATWGSPAKDKFHADLAADINSNNPYKSIDKFIDTEVPLWVFEVEDKSYLKELLIGYHNCMVKSIEVNGGRRLRYPEMPDQCEYKISEGFDSFTKKIRSQYPFQAFIVSPLYKRGREYIFHSAIHTWRSLDDYKLKPFKLAIKAIAYLINVLLWLLSIAYLLTSRPLAEKILLGIVPVASFVFMVYYRHVEGRYLLGIYPFLYLMSAMFLYASLKPWLRRVFINLGLIRIRY